MSPIIIALNNSSGQSCSANFSFNKPYIFCPPLSINFIDSSTASTAITSWFWDFGDGQTSNVKNPTHTYVYRGTYDVTLIITTQDGCKDTLAKNDYIYIGGPLLINYDIDTAYCNPYPLTITLFLTVFNTKWIILDCGDGKIDSYTVAMPDTENIILTHTYMNAGTYSPYLYLWDSANPPPANMGTCGFQKLPDIEMPLFSMLDFTVDNISCIPCTVNFVNTSSDTDNVDLWQWNFGDTAAGVSNITNTFNGTHYYSQPGNYDVILSAYVFFESTGDTCISALHNNFSMTNTGVVPKTKKELMTVTVTPNFFHKFTQILIDTKQLPESDLKLVLYDIFGRKMTEKPIIKNQITLERNILLDGFYFYTLTNSENIIAAGKLIVE